MKTSKIVFQKFITVGTKIFNVSYKISSIASIDAFIVISGDIFHALDLKSKIFAGISFVKFQVFAINREENYYKGTAPNTRAASVNVIWVSFD